MRLVLRFYGWLFLAVGLLFVSAERPVLGVLSWAGSLAGLPPLAASGPSLWLGLTGSLMCVIARLALRLGEDPGQGAAWEALLLSKAVSAALFAAFFARTGNPLFLAASGVDASILLHLAWLRRLHEGGPGLLPRLAPPSPSYEVWFARLNDPESRRALWVRYCLSRTARGAQASCWAIFFDPGRGRVVSRRWTGPAAASGDGWLFRMGDSGIGADALGGSGDGVGWDLRWKPGDCPAVDLVPAWLRAVGATRRGYDSAAPGAAFTGSAVLDGETWTFREAAGCVGHVWGDRLGPGWWWAHAVFPGGKEGGVVFEILSAPGPLGRRATSAFLWKDGRLHRSTGPWDLLRNASGREADRWSFRVRFAAASVEGDCALGLAADLDYEGPDGRKLRCRNSKVSRMRLRVNDGQGTRELSTEAAAVEFVEPAP